MMNAEVTADSRPAWRAAQNVTIKGSGELTKIKTVFASLSYHLRNSVSYSSDNP